MKVNTYPEMNEKIKEILRIGGTPSGVYAAQRIEELEKEVEGLKKVKTVSDKSYRELLEMCGKYESAFMTLLNKRDWQSAKEVEDFMRNTLEDGG